MKVIQNASQEMIDEIVVTSNNQNPMNPRNLKSNSREQKDVQKSFASIPEGRWFYVRKDGEFDAMLSEQGKHAAFKKKDFVVPTAGSGRPRYRRIDNTDVAKSWYSWIGYSGAVLAGGIKFFDDEHIYERIFLQRPTAAFWDAFKQPAFEKPSPELLEPITPTAHQYLLARAVAAFIKSSNPSPYRNRLDALTRAVKEKTLKGDPETGECSATPKQKAQFLSEDKEYVRNTYLYNMEDVLTELFSFVLVRRYGALDPQTSRALLRLPDVQAWCLSALQSPLEDFNQTYRGGLLSRTTQFLKWAIGQNYFTEAKYEIEAASRAKMYFAKRDSIKSMRSVVVESNDLVSDAVKPWKQIAGQSFIDSLPDLADENHAASDVSPMAD